MGEWRAVASWVGIAFMVGGPILQLGINVALSRRDRKDFEDLRESHKELRNDVVKLQLKVAAYTGDGNGAH